jgi:purine-binding chemotaxis protein CheW
MSGLSDVLAKPILASVQQSKGVGVTQTTVPAAPSATAINRGGKFLTFALGKEEYGIAILKVREIIGCMEVTPVPRTPSYVRGVINLRGQVIPVIDLRAKFGMETLAATDETCIVVVEITRDGRTLSTGLVVDRVREVLSINPEAVEDAPDLGTSVDSKFIQGLGKVGQHVKILLDIDRVLTAGEAHELSNAAGQPVAEAA